MFGLNTGILLLDHFRVFKVNTWKYLAILEYYDHFGRLFQVWPIMTILPIMASLADHCYFDW